MKKICVFLMILCAAAVFADDTAMPRLTIPTARASGMGGHHVAYTDNVFSLLVNPAAVMRVEQRSFFALSPTLLSPQTTIGAIGSIMDSDWQSLQDKIKAAASKDGNIQLGLDVRELPLSIAWVSDGFGFGIWNRTFVNANVKGGTYLALDAYEDIMVPIGFAFKIIDTGSHALDAGVAVKPFARVKLTGGIDILDLANDDKRDEMIDNLNVPLIVGAGVDAGLMYRWDIGLSAGAAFNDIVTRGVVAAVLNGADSNTYYVPFAMDLGVAYDFKLGRFWTSAPSFLAATGITFMADWHDVFNLFQQDDYTKRNALLDLSLGVQVSIFDLMFLRAGMNELLPAVGVGFDLGPVELDLAYYGKELGREPGQASTAALDLTVAIRPGAKKRDWPWTRKSVVGMITKSENW